VIWKIERTERLVKPLPSPPAGGDGQGDGFPAYVLDEPIVDGLQTLRVVVEEVKGKCTAGMQPGDFFILRTSRIYIPADRHFCLYALQAVLPLLPAKQRSLAEDDWLREEAHAICPDPAGNVIMRIEDL
jgi:uncharacterized repeat protein (TIGR04076 family)